jgi:putative component of toxin-antitoxin plasmid stabilization module
MCDSKTKVYYQKHDDVTYLVLCKSEHVSDRRELYYEY